MAKVYEQLEQAGVNVIAQGSTFVGDITTTGDCRIDGIVKGNITSNAKIFVGKQGEIQGEVKCFSIEIEGNVKANIVTKDILTLKSTAVMDGNVVVDKIAIEPGAQFVGSCKMQNGQAPMPTTQE